MPQQLLEAFKCAACGVRIDLMTDGTISGAHREGCDQASASDKAFDEAKSKRAEAQKLADEQIAAAQTDLTAKPAEAPASPPSS